MADVFVAADNIISPLGYTSAENFDQLKKNGAGIKKHEANTISSQPFYASLFEDDSFLKVGKDVAGHTLFEQLLIASITGALKNCDIDPQDNKTLLIISSTKGNISLLESNPLTPELKKRIALHTSARIVAGHFKFAHRPIIVSNACISGLLGIITGMRMIQSGQYENVIIAGADVITKFILSGFLSFQAISEEPCRPFDAERKGINLGEGAATMILSSNKIHTIRMPSKGGFWP